MEPVTEEALPPRGQQLGNPPSLHSAARDNDSPYTPKMTASDTMAARTEPETSGSTDEIRRSPSPSPAKPTAGVVPPYWRHSRAASRASHVSLDSSTGRLITLEDHSEDLSCDTSRGLWARSVTIDDYVVVKGTTGIGAYVVWNCKIETLEVGSLFPLREDLNLKICG